MMNYVHVYFDQILKSRLSYGQNYSHFLKNFMKNSVVIFEMNGLVHFACLAAHQLKRYQNSNSIYFKTIQSTYVYYK